MKLLAGITLALLIIHPALAAKQPPPAQGLEQRVELLERKVRTLSDLLMRLDSLQREVQQLRGEVELQNHAMDALKKRQRDLYLDVDKRLGQIKAPVQPGTAQAGTSVAPDAAAPSKPVDTAAPVAGPATGVKRPEIRTQVATTTPPKAVVPPKAPVDDIPSGDPHPSADDRRFTEALVQAGKALQITVLDHIIIGNDKYFSFGEQGMI